MKTANTEFVNKLILGDNLEVLKSIEDNSIDLIYLDPPFFSNRTYEVIWGDDGEVRSFEDRFEGDIEKYISWLDERVELMYRKLKPTGSMFLHCDWHANAYIRVEILDKIFGRNNFRNEIIWQRTRNPKGSQFDKKNFGVATDTVFWYSKSANYYFDEIAARTVLEGDDLNKKYSETDEKGSYYAGPVIRGASMGERPNLVYEYKGFTPDNYGWRMTKEKLEQLDKDGDLGWSSNGKPFRKLRPDNDKGNPVYNLWTDLNRIYAQSPEFIGYPTQKPEALLERIIQCASSEGDIVLDPFVGGGTTVAVADKLGRKWIGIDQSAMAIKVSDLRLKKQHDVFSQPYDLILRKFDYDFLRNSDAFKFESWIIAKFGGTPNAKQRSDGSIDGKAADGAPVQVKRSDNISVNVVKNFWASLQQHNQNLFDENVKEGKTAGYIIAFSFGKGAVEEVARLRNKNGVIIKLVKVSDIVDYGTKPDVSLSASIINENEFEFIAKAESETGIDFFAWDFSHNENAGFKPDILFDKAGKQTKKFLEGEHQIAVEAIDREGISGTDKVKIKVKKQQ